MRAYARAALPPKGRTRPRVPLQTSLGPLPEGHCAACRRAATECAVKDFGLRDAGRVQARRRFRGYPAHDGVGGSRFHQFGKNVGVENDPPPSARLQLWNSIRGIEVNSIQPRSRGGLPGGRNPVLERGQNFARCRLCQFAPRHMPGVGGRSVLSGKTRFRPSIQLSGISTGMTLLPWRR